MDEIQKWYDQFGKPEGTDHEFKVWSAEARGGRQTPIAHILLGSDGRIQVNDNRPRPLSNHNYVGVETARALADIVPEVVTARRAIEGTVDSELNWDLDKIGTIVGFLGELPADLLDDDKLSAGTLYEVLANLHEELGGE